jgi:transcriptional regulator with XRE-family HTH domain
MMALSGEVKKARAAMGLSQEEYAKLVGLHQQTISRIEAGDGGVTLKTLTRLMNKGGLIWTPRGPSAGA